MSDDETQLLDARPVLELFFAGDGLWDHCEAFEVDELVYFVSAGEAVGVDAVFVLGYTGFDLCGDADIEALEAAGHDVNVRLLDHEEILPR